ncbi:cuticle protein AMP1B-like [Panulirus ornatus]|uniref:cuticle protein AMP1B-like n=1 Tax=Panulirus ornatus TaxID=150431 RepID=UPI003A84B4FB
MIVRAFLPMAVVVAVSAGPAVFNVPPQSAPGGISSAQRPQRPPPPLTAPGGISSAQQPYPPPEIPILIDERVGPLEDGTYSFNFETANGISRHEQGSPQGEAGAVAAQGGWSFTFPDGTPAVVTFVADENGYRPQSDLLPTPHPLPAHAIAQIEFARQEQALEAAGGGGGRYGP